MNRPKLFVRNIFDDLVERKLWPVALILLVALIAIPVLLAKPSSKSTAPLPGAGATVPAVSGASSPLTAFEPVVSTTDVTTEHKAQQGHEKNPFTPKGINLSASSAAGNAAPINGVGTAVAAPSTAQGTSTAPGATAPGSQNTSGTEPTKFYTYTIKVNFGEEGNTKTLKLSQFRAIPSSDNPVAIFMGVKKDGKTAVFLLSSSTTTTGDGRCAPTDSNCTFLYMKEGDSQVIETVTSDGQIVTYQLDLEAIVAEPVKAPDTAKSSQSPSANDSARDPARARTRTALRAFTRLPF